MLGVRRDLSRIPEFVRCSVVDQSTQLVETGSDVDAFEAARSVRGVKAFLLASGGTFLRIPGGSTNDFSNR